MTIPVYKTFYKTDKMRSDVSKVIEIINNLNLIEQRKIKDHFRKTENFSLAYMSGAKYPDETIFYSERALALIVVSSFFINFTGERETFFKNLAKESISDFRFINLTKSTDPNDFIKKFIDCATIVHKKHGLNIEDLRDIVFGFFNWFELLEKGGPAESKENYIFRISQEFYKYQE